MRLKQRNKEKITENYNLDLQIRDGEWQRLQIDDGKWKRITNRWWRLKDQRRSAMMEVESSEQIGNDGGWKLGDVEILV